MEGVNLTRMSVLFTAAAKVLLMTGAEVTNPDAKGVRKAFTKEGSLREAAKIEGCGSEMIGVEPWKTGVEKI